MNALNLRGGFMEVVRERLSRGSRFGDSRALARTSDPHPRLVMEFGDGAAWAIGDVHGRLDLLELVMETIDRQDDTERTAIVLLGDVVDRGPKSASVIDYLIELRRRGRPVHTLAGNHEMLMLDFMAAPSVNHPWLQFGGRETLRSYTVDIERHLKPAQLRHLLGASIPEEHLEFLRALPVSIETESYFFCHAGIREGVALKDQRQEDLLWVNDGMKSDYASAEKLVVHGHQALDEPLTKGHRLNLDTGAYATGHLSAARLVDGRVDRLFTTAKALDRPAATSRRIHSTPL